MRARGICWLSICLGACVGGAAKDLPTAAAPTTPPPTVQLAEVLTAETPTTLLGEPGSSTIVQVRAATAAGAPVNAALLSFVVIAGGGSVDPVVATTANGGLASARWTFGAAPGVNLLKVSGGGAGATPVNFTASTAAPSASRAP